MRSCGRDSRHGMDWPAETRCRISWWRAHFVWSYKRMYNVRATAEPSRGEPVACCARWIPRQPSAVNSTQSPRFFAFLLLSKLFMAALCNRGALYFCPVVSFYLLSFFYLSFFIPRLMSAATDTVTELANTQHVCYAPFLGPV